MDALQEGERVTVSNATLVVLEKTTPMNVTTVANKPFIVRDNSVTSLATDSVENNASSNLETKVMKEDD